VTVFDMYSMSLIVYKWKNFTA